MDSGATIVMRSDFEADRAAESVTVAVKSKMPAVVGVPETTPALDIVKPFGMLAPGLVQVYGVVPLLADSVW